MDPQKQQPNPYQNSTGQTNPIAPQAPVVQPEPQTQPVQPIQPVQPESPITEVPVSMPDQPADGVVPGANTGGQPTGGQTA